jgi:hypothetical protein
VAGSRIQVVPLLPVGDAHQDTGQDADDELQLSPGQVRRIEQLRLDPPDKPLPPTPKAVASPAASSPASSSSSSGSSPASASSNGTISKSPSLRSINNFFREVMNPIGIGLEKKEKRAKNEKKLPVVTPTAHPKRALNARPEFFALLGPLLQPELTANALKQKEASERVQAADYREVVKLVEEMKAGKKTREDLFKLLNQYDTVEKLKPLLPQICTLLSSRELFDFMLVRSAETTQNSSPFRESSAGLSIFCFLLSPEFDRALGESAFSQIAYELICKTMPLGRIPEKAKGQPLASPDENLSLELCKLFMNRVTSQMETFVGGRLPAVQERMNFLLGTIRRQNYRLITPEKLLLSIFILRFVNRDLNVTRALLQESSDLFSREVATYFLALSKLLQKQTNLLATDNVPMGPEQECIFRSLIS